MSKVIKLFESLLPEWCWEQVPWADELENELMLEAELKEELSSR